MAKKKGSASQADKSVEAFRDALERSVTISRDRIQEVVDEAVKRGRMTRGDANEMVSKLVARGRQQTEDLISELEKLAGQARQDIDQRVKAAGEAAEGAADQLRRTVSGSKASGGSTAKAKPAKAKPAKKAKSSSARKSSTTKKKSAAKKPAAKGGGSKSAPIANYEKLTVAEVKRRLSRLDAAGLRAVRTQEKAGKARKGVLAEIEKRLG